MIKTERQSRDAVCLHEIIRRPELLPSPPPLTGSNSPHGVNNDQSTQPGHAAPPAFHFSTHNHDEGQHTRHDMSDTPQQRPLSTAPGFQPASSLPRSTHAPSLSSNRNAGGGQRLPPKTGESSSTVAAAPGGGPSAPAPPSGPSKPVNRPAASKNAIVHSVLQVGLLTAVAGLSLACLRSSAATPSCH